jgi:allantoinase
MSSFDLLVQGRVVTPDIMLEEGWVAINKDQIVAVGTGPAPDARRTDSYGDSLIFPGIIDGQTHAGSYQGLAGIESTTRSAIAGGVTTIVDMPYDNPEPLNTVERLDDKVEAIQKFAYCDVALYATVAKGQGVAAVQALVNAGIVAFKISAFESHSVRFPRIPNNEALDLLEALAPTSVPLGIHNEDQEVVLSRIADLKAKNLKEPSCHEPSRPLAAELAATATFLELGAAAGAHAHIVHLSHESGFDLVKAYRERGTRSTGELCVHYLLLDADRDIARLGAQMKVNPPIRGGAIDGLWQALERGDVEFVSSDHSSWPIDNKLTSSIFDAGAGIPGLETLVPGFFTFLSERHSNPERLLALYLCEKPARFFGLWPRKGCVAPGADADLMVLSPETWTFDASKTHDDLNWSPFDGASFRGRVQATYLRGQIAFSDGVVRGQPGMGTYVPRVPA